MTLVVIGLGYSALRIARREAARFGRIVGTVRSPETARRLDGEPVTIRLFDGKVSDPALAGDLRDARALLVSAPPGPDGDPALGALAGALAEASRLAWIGYLSTVGVYGDHGGGWVDEATAPRPASVRSRQRLAAEAAWTAFGRETGRPVALFRLSGIYGPGRNALRNLREGTARRLVKPGQVFNRIHVDDIAGAVSAALDRPKAGGVFNVTDDEPAPPQDVVAYAAALLGLEPPPETPFETADLSPMARSFYGENKRVRNARVKDVLGYRFAHPTYRAGLRALLAAGD